MQHLDWQTLTDQSREKMAAARALVREQKSAIVAFSGGVDSSLVLRIALDELGDQALALTAVSPAVPPREREAARHIAQTLGARHVFVGSSEINDPNYTSNPINRCYFCKSELYDLCRAEAASRGLAAVLDGFNADEAGDHRPGRQAGEERQVISPLLAAGLDKREIRAWSRKLGLPTWDKPQLACLASRIPYGTTVTADRLGRVAKAEEALQDLGFRIFRVRFHDDVARVELGEAELERAFGDASLRGQMIERVRATGFRFVAVDLEPFRTGRMNEGVVPKAAPLPVIF